MTNWTKILTLGASGTATNQLNGPTAIAIDYPYLWIADNLNSRILKWELNGGKYVDSISSVKAYALEIIGDHIYAAVTTDDKVHMYDKHTLSEVRSSAAFTTLSNMTQFRNNLYVVDYSTNTIYKLDPSTLNRLQTAQISGASGNYKAIAALGNYLYVLTDSNIVYRVKSDLEYDNKSVDLSSYLSAADYICAHEDYLFITGGDADYVLIDAALQFIANEDFDTDDWTTAYDIRTLSKHVFLAADFTGDCIVCMYGYDRDSGKASGDAITITDDGDWDFGDDIIIGGTEANMSTVSWVRSVHVKPQSRNAWLRS